MPNAPCPILLFLGYANDFSTRRYANAQYKCPMPNAQSIGK
ncbi:MAG: hypothetical protein ACYTXL_00665 [Nostoc sp.]